MNTGKSCELFVSAKAYDSVPPTERERSFGFPMPASRELCTGHRLTLTGKVSGEWMECIGRHDEVLWLHESFVSHAV